MKKFKRIFTIVVDSFGIGAMADAVGYGDEGADTYGHIMDSCPELSLPNMEKIGLTALHPVQGKPQTGEHAVCMKMNEKSNGKDTMTGHWEMMGVETKVPFQTFTETGFPEELIRRLEAETGREIIGNCSASGTEILDRLAEEEIQNGKLIVYTSADSVLQICGNEETMGLETLYRYCKIARELTMEEKWRVGRVIARPYIGKKKGEFVRTSNRHDYALAPPCDTVLDLLKDNGVYTVAVGKIQDIFSGHGICKYETSKSSVHGMEQTIAIAKEDFEGFCFVNLVDFDAKWGHRRDPQGYAKELENFDEKLGILMDELNEDDLLIVTADHGNDPTHRGTDHTREQVPFLAYSKAFSGFKVLEDADSFGAVGATIAENFGVDLPENLIGTSVLDKMNIK